MISCDRCGSRIENENESYYSTRVYKLTPHERIMLLRDGADNVLAEYATIEFDVEAAVDPFHLCDNCFKGLVAWLHSDEILGKLGLKRFSKEPPAVDTGL